MTFAGISLLVCIFKHSTRMSTARQVTKYFVLKLIKGPTGQKYNATSLRHDTTSDAV